MIIIGLTGSIGMGKSTAAGIFRRLRIPVYDSDLSVHRVLGVGGAAVAPIGRLFSSVVKEGKVDRDALGKRVFSDPEALKELEEIVHPLVRRKQDSFLRLYAARRSPIVVLDIPLLFEVGLNFRCDLSIVVSAPQFIQEARVLARPGMTREKFTGIVARQMSDHEKCRRADFVIPSNRGKRETLRRLTNVLNFAKSLSVSHWPHDPFYDRIATERSLNA
ncbi:MAG: dephospho-CoA kinase [Pseudomonadota bacterium]|nr:dephospho-CoA kinase [Pseudomonadota bacterium]